MHAIDSIEEAFANEKENLSYLFIQIKEQRKDLQQLINKIDSNVFDLKMKSNDQIYEITSFFEELKNIINEREQTLKNEIYELTQSLQNDLKSQENQFNKQLIEIETIINKDEYLLDLDNQQQFLENMSLTKSQLNQIIKSKQDIKFEIPFQKMEKQQEINSIIKDLQKISGNIIKSQKPQNHQEIKQKNTKKCEKNKNLQKNQSKDNNLTLVKKEEQRKKYKLNNIQNHLQNHQFQQNKQKNHIKQFKSSAQTNSYLNNRAIKNVKNNEVKQKMATENSLGINSDDSDGQDQPIHLQLKLPQENFKNSHKTVNQLQDGIKRQIKNNEIDLKNSHKSGKLQSYSELRNILKENRSQVNLQNKKDVQKLKKEKPLLTIQESQDNIESKIQNKENQQYQINQTSRNITPQRKQTKTNVNSISPCYSKQPIKLGQPMSNFFSHSNKEINLQAYKNDKHSSRNKESHIKKSNKKHSNLNNRGLSDVEFSAILNDKAEKEESMNKDINVFLQDINSSQENLKDQYTIDIDTTGKKYDLTNFYKQISQSYIYVLGGFADKQNTAVEIYDIQNNTWRQIQQITNFNRTKFGAVQINKDNILIMGGKVNGKRVDSCQELNINTNQISDSKVKMTQVKSGFGIVHYENDVYFIGGNDGQQTLKVVEKLNLMTQEFQQLSCMHNDRDELAVTLGNDNCLYAIGGFGGENQTSLDSAERFNLKTFKWEKIASMNVKRRALTAVCLPDGIYAIGGFDGQNYLSSVEKYDENLNKWIFVSPLNHPRCTFSSIISPDFKYIYAIGGFNNGPLDTVERYSVVTENWEVINFMPNKRFMHNCILIQQQVYSNQNSPYIYKENY